MDSMGVFFGTGTIMHPESYRLQLSTMQLDRRSWTVDPWLHEILHPTLPHKIVGEQRYKLRQIYISMCAHI